MMYVVNDEFEPISSGSVLIRLHRYDTLGTTYFFKQLGIDVVRSHCDGVCIWGRDSKVRRRIK